MSKKTIVLDHERVQRKLKRIAHQLHEEHHGEHEIVLVGVMPRGKEFAERLAGLLRTISTAEVTVQGLSLDKDHPLQHPITLSGDPEALKDRVVILVDDVLMSGRTLMHAASHLVRTDPRILSTVVLVDRLHRTFPIRADIVGLTLSTTLQEHITVEMGKEDVVYLT